MRRVLIAAAVTALLSACASGPPARPPSPSPLPEAGDRLQPGGQPLTIGLRAADAARAFLGVPYRYGGQDPSGFDCSGLVWYVYRQLGITLPRRALDQRRAVAPVPRDELKPGDLIFFSSPADHVGIYLGAGDFVHAPSAGKDVRVASLNAPYFMLAYAGAGRVGAP
jgi:peptidoglycan DL-endopeptidase CwlO